MGKEAVAVLRSYKLSPGDLRGIGVQLSKLEPIKISPAAPDGSQKMISFGKPASGPPSKKARHVPDPIVDDASPAKAGVVPPARAGREDPIDEDPLTPRKPKVHPALALAKANAADERARTPLNVAGTQFILPANPDPAVLAALPQDIRSKLLAQGRPTVWSASREATPSVQDGMPPDIDPDVFHALPDDVKAEVLASYSSKRPGQPRLFPPSPRKDRIIKQSLKTTPPKRGIRGALGRARERQHDADSKLVQTNFLTGAAGRSFAGHRHPKDESPAGDIPEAAAGQTVDAMEELDPSILAELPEDLRREVMADHRRRKLAHKSGLSINQPPPPAWRDAVDSGLDGADLLPGDQTRLQFPAAPAKVAFANTALRTVAEIKDMLAVWHGETRDEGPHRADVELLERYLARVVTEERDMEKARKLVVWLDWMVDERDGQTAGEKGGETARTKTKGRNAWRKAVASVRRAVQEAVRERGLGPMDLG
ncbi:hypothetical protein P8C59_007191 [Phyllachora maydis]|uniref:DNA repair protein Rev1 C-terminal domain-containing protein n=2 Tax=Phyllachora maydis TaxID=1825666 RepID=A0AAD9I7W9_9PEZI|nr:hypothetical protein P8C59_007191 [Phyllachora maydis]